MFENVPVIQVFIPRARVYEKTNCVSVFHQFCLNQSPIPGTYKVIHFRSAGVPFSGRKIVKNMPFPVNLDQVT